MALLAGLVIAALPDRAALTFAVVPSANISASFTTSTIRPRNKSDQIYFRLFASDKTESCEFQDNWVKTPSQDSMGGRLLSLTNLEVSSVPLERLDVHSFALSVVHNCADFPSKLCNFRCSQLWTFIFSQLCTFIVSQLCTLTIVHINCSSDSVQFGRCVKVQAYQNANIELCVSPAVIWSRTKISKETFNLDTFELKISRLNILQKCFVFPFVASHLSLNKMFHFRKLYY